jgi:hypothetical protein
MVRVWNRVVSSSPGRATPSKVKEPMIQSPMNEPTGFLPEARRGGIIRKEVDGELLIYDLTRDKAHCLNESAAAIWKLCDGRTSTKDIAASLSKEVGASVDERVVWLALADLRRSHLLEEPKRIDQGAVRNNSQSQRKQSGQWPPAILGMSRREAVKRIGLGAAIALPVVISITAPTAVQAASLKASGENCTSSAECASGGCDPSSGKCI